VLEAEAEERLSPSKSGEVVSLTGRHRLAAPIHNMNNPEEKPPSTFPHELAKDD
jgi:hypothetical protein